MTNPRTSASPDQSAPDNRLALTPIQRAWLAEIGVGSDVLAVFRRPDRPTAEPPQSELQPTQRPQSVQATFRSAPPVRAPQPAPEQPKPAPAKQPTVVSIDDLPATPEGLHEYALQCQACELHEQRHHAVPGAGDVQQPQWLVVGEAPGSADDRVGRPFQGKPGELLRAMLAAAGLQASLWQADEAPQPPGVKPVTMFFTNVVKCRPLGNRPPSDDHIAACSALLHAQIQQLQPAHVLVVGRLAAQALLNTQTPLEELRGRVHQFAAPDGRTLPLVVTWHPATLLVHPHRKAQAWEDLALVRNLTQEAGKG